MSHAKSAARRAAPAALRAEIERFLDRAHSPALLEDGRAPLLLEADHWRIECDARGLRLQAWSEERNATLRVVDAAAERAGALALTVQSLRGESRVRLADLASAAAKPALDRAFRGALEERLRRMVARQWPGFRVAEATSGGDLENTLSPAFPRAFLQRGQSAWAALGAPAQRGFEGLTFGLLWLDYLRRRERRRAVEGLAYFCPAAEVDAVKSVLPGLDAARLRLSLFAYDEEGREWQVETGDRGNAAASLLPAPAAQSAIPSIPDVEVLETGPSSWSLRVRGLEFARAGGGECHLTLDANRRASWAEVEGLARKLAEVRSADASGREHPWWRRQPEGWLESAIRARPELLLAEGLGGPLYGQVIARAGFATGIADLLSLDGEGRVVVAEVKAVQNLHLPLQALDYWLQVRAHLESGALVRAGYFRGCALSAAAPRLLLVAPALDFHPTTERILRFFDPAIEVERVGLGPEWRRSPKVTLRLKGASRAEWEARGR